jgi:ubiquinone/menaquinone biosynthesis C-methylase UbiE
MKKMCRKKPDRKIIKDFKKGLLEYTINDDIYSIFAKYYDLIMSDIDYYSWYEYLMDIIEKFRLNIGNVLDLACGTGSVLCYFVRDGYNCLGIDKSSYMLELARQKLNKYSKSNQLIQSDMTKYVSDKKFNLIYSFNDSVNYLTSIKSLTDFLYTAYDLLEVNGLLVFDVSTEYNILKNFSSYIYEEYKEFAFLWNNYYEKSKKIVFSELDFLIYDTLDVVREKHIQRIYTKNEISKQSSIVGFKIIGVFDGFTFRKPHKRSEIIHFILKK